MKPSSAEKLAFSLRRVHRCFPNKFISIFIPIYYYRYSIIAHISEMSIPYLKKNLCAGKTAGLPERTAPKARLCRFLMEALIKSARTVSERFFGQSRYRKGWNTVCTRKGYAASVSRLTPATAALYFPFSVPKSGRKRSAHSRRRFIQRFPYYVPR